MNKAKSLFYLAAFGLVASAATHVATFFGVNPLGAGPGIMVLHALIFVVWIPTVVFVVRRMSGGNDRWAFWAVVTRHAPLWMKALSIVLAAYAFFSFFFVEFVLNREGVPSTSSGQKALVSHGKVIRRLSDEEYERHQAYSIRGYSGHWMMFYAVGMTVLCSLAKEAATKDRGSAAETPCQPERIVFRLGATYLQVRVRSVRRRKAAERDWARALRSVWRPCGFRV